MPLTEHELAAIRAAVENDAAAVRRADWDGITHLFTADVIRFPPQPDGSWLWTTDMAVSELPAPKA